MASSCPHTAALCAPLASQTVYRDECTRCFATHDDPVGISVCLHCFNGMCPNMHSAMHRAAQTGHVVELNVRRVPKVVENDGTVEMPERKISKLEVTPEIESDRYIFVKQVYCTACSIEIDPTSDDQLAAVVDGVMGALTAAKQTEVRAWEASLTSCEHTLLLHPEPTQTSVGKTCSDCDVAENLWLCMTCGHLGCGRRQYDGSGGNGHAMAHFKANSHHGVVCKLATITAEGTADIYCYVCDDERVDPNFAEHLHACGINIADRQKTERSMAELQLEQNLNFDFSMVSADGEALSPVYGPGRTGLKNLGNSCYIASVLQSVVALPAYAKRYASVDTALTHWSSCHEVVSANCWECQMIKITRGMTSGEYAQAPDQTHSTPYRRNGLSPAMLKAMVGRGHVEFSTARQQDAFEFYQHLLRLTEQRERTSSTVTGGDPSAKFRFRLEHRIECGRCHGVRYTQEDTTSVQLPVPKTAIVVGDGEVDEEYKRVALADCLDAFTRVESLDGWYCPRCDDRTFGQKTTRFATFPDHLVLGLSRFELRNWVPSKLLVPVAVPDASFDMTRWRGAGLQMDEEVLPDTATTPAVHDVDATDLAQLTEMGFPEVRCRKALLANPGAGAEAAMNWLFQHMEDADIDAPIDVSSGSANGLQVSNDKAAMLADMGFSMAQARKALRETNDDAERAVDWLFSHSGDYNEEADQGASSSQQPVSMFDDKPAAFDVHSVISHKGTSVHCGHYVAHLRYPAANNERGEWVLFNDDRVVHVREGVAGLSEKDVYIVVLSRSN